MYSHESLALAKRVRVSSGMLTLTFQPILPSHGQVMVLGKVLTDWHLETRPPKTSGTSTGKTLHTTGPIGPFCSASLYSVHKK